MSKSGYRINWLDTSRGLSFLMVIYYHLHTKNSIIVPYFSPVFLTTFFFVSGYLSKSGQDFFKVFEQRTRTLFVPFLIFGLGGGLMMLLIKNQTDTFMDGIIDTFKDVFYQYGEHQTLWFIASLYLYGLVFYWVDRLCKSPLQLLEMSVLLVAANQVICYIMYCPMLPWRVNHCLYACAIMGFGKVYKTKEEWIDRIIMKRWIAVLSLTIYLLLIYWGQQDIIYYGSSNWFFALSIPFTGMLSIVYISKKIVVNNKALLFVGSNSLIYFVLHRQVLNVIESLANKLLFAFEFEPSFGLNIIEVLMIAALLAIPTYIINTYMPWILGKRWTFHF